MNDMQIAYLRPGQVRERLDACPVIYVPLGPIEWHGPHLPLGTDAIHAERTALAACEKTGGLVWQTLFFGTERERPPDMLESLGFGRGDYIVGMDFPNNSLPSAYTPEEIFAVAVREVLRTVALMGARIAVLVNRHGGVNHLAVLDRLATEIDRTTDVRVLCPRTKRKPDDPPASGGHADEGETSLVMHLCGDAVDLGQLPPADTPIRYADFAIVDGPGFDGSGPPDHVLANDPRKLSSAERGREKFTWSVERLVEQVTAALAE